MKIRGGTAAAKKHGEIVQEGPLFLIRREIQRFPDVSKIARECTRSVCRFCCLRVAEMLLKNEPLTERGLGVLREEHAEARHEPGRLGERHAAILRAPR